MHRLVTLAILCFISINVASSANEKSEAGVSACCSDIQERNGAAKASCRTMGNIAPYRKRMLKLIRQNYLAEFKGEQNTIQVSISKKGKIIHWELLEKSPFARNNRLTSECMKRSEENYLLPLPDWYHGEQLTFNVDFEKIRQIKLPRPRYVFLSHHCD